MNRHRYINDIMMLLIPAVLFLGVRTANPFSSEAGTETKEIKVQYLSVKMPASWKVIPESAMKSFRDLATQELQQIAGEEYPGRIDLMLAAQEANNKAALVLMATTFDRDHQPSLQYARDQSEKRILWGIEQKRLLSNYEKSEFDVNGSHILEYRCESPQGQVVFSYAVIPSCSPRIGIQLTIIYADASAEKSLNIKNSIVSSVAIDPLLASK